MCGMDKLPPLVLVKQEGIITICFSERHLPSNAETASSALELPSHSSDGEAPEPGSQGHEEGLCPLLPCGCTQVTYHGSLSPKSPCLPSPGLAHIKLLSSDWFLFWRIPKFPGKKNESRQVKEKATLCLQKRGW